MDGGWSSVVVVIAEFEERFGLNDGREADGQHHEQSTVIRNLSLRMFVLLLQPSKS